MSAPAEPGPVGATSDAGLLAYTNWIYGLHALSVCIGLLTSASVAGRFVFGLPSIAAVIMNYVRRGDAEGTRFAAHFRWQIRTFWFAALWLLIVNIISLPLMLILIGFVVWWIGFLAVGAWVIYRVVRGWLALRDGKALPSGFTS